MESKVRNDSVKMGPGIYSAYMCTVVVVFSEKWNDSILHIRRNVAVRIWK